MGKKRFLRARSTSEYDARLLTLEDFSDIQAWCGGTTWSRPPMRAVTGLTILDCLGPVDVPFGWWIVKFKHPVVHWMALSPEEFQRLKPYKGEPMPDLTPNMIAILDHTVHRAPRGMYCGSSLDMQALVKMGYMASAGKASFMVDEHFRITDAGREALRKAKERI